MTSHGHLPPARPRGGLWNVLALIVCSPALISAASAQPARQRQAELSQRYKAEHALPIPTAKADLTLSCAPGVTAEIWFGAGIIVWHVPAGPQVWRLGTVTPTTIPFQRVIEAPSAYPAGAVLVYVVVYADIDRATGEVHYRIEDQAISHTSGTCDKAVPHAPAASKF